MTYILCKTRKFSIFINLVQNWLAILFLFFICSFKSDDKVGILLLCWLMPFSLIIIRPPTVVQNKPISKLCQFQTPIPHFRTIKTLSISNVLILISFQIYTYYIQNGANSKDHLSCQRKRSTRILKKQTYQIDYK